MRYEFIKIVDTQEGQYAYMLDHERGVIVVAPVEYLGEAPVERVPAPRPVRSIVPAPIRRAPVREVIQEETEVVEEVVKDKTPVMRGGPVAGEGVDATGLHDIGHSRPQKTQSIMPPHLRGILKKDGAVESRETIG